MAIRFVLAISLMSFFLSSVLTNPCSVLLNQNVTVFYDWPYNLTCPYTDAKCEVNTESGKLTSSYIIIDEKNTTDSKASFHYNLTSRFTNGSCLTWKVLVNMKALPSLTQFEDYLHHKHFNTSKFDYRVAIFRKQQVITCLDDDSDLYYPAGSYKIDWYQIEIDENGNLKKYTDVTDPDLSFHLINGGKKISFPATYNDVGIYTCKIRYKGTTLMASHTQICVKQDTPLSSPSLHCVKESRLEQGGDVLVTCYAHIDSRIVAENDIKVVWYRKSEDYQKIVCNNTNLDQVNTIERFTCQVDDLPNRERVCYESRPPEDGIEDATESLPISLKIRNLKSSDEEPIYVKLEHFGVSSKEVEIILKFDEFKKGLISIMVVVPIILAVVLAMIIWHFCKHKLLIFYRRHFGRYDKDNKEYVAIFSYEFNSNLDGKAKEDIRNMVKWTKNLFEKKNYNYCDPYQDMDVGGAWAETFFKQLDKSHRMIIFMTPDYIKESKARFQTKQAMENMERNKTKVIVVRTKETKETLLEMRNSDERVRFINELQNAVTGMRKVKYKDGMSEEEFSVMLDCALPNLNRDVKKPQKKGSFNLSYKPNNEGTA